MVVGTILLSKKKTQRNNESYKKIAPNLTSSSASVTVLFFVSAVVQRPLLNQRLSLPWVGTHHMYSGFSLKRSGRFRDGGRLPGT